MLSIPDFLLNEVGGNPQKKEKIPSLLKQISESTPFTFVDTVRGDGNCLIRAILRHIRKHTPNFLVEVCIHLFELAHQDIEIPFFGDRSKEDEYDEKLSQLIRKLIVSKWSEHYKGDAAYHMDDSAIDGLAVEMTMRLLGVTELKIFQAFDGADRKTGWRIITVPQTYHNGILSLTVPILTINGCHYSAIV